MVEPMPKKLAPQFSTQAPVAQRWSVGSTHRRSLVQIQVGAHGEEANASSPDLVVRPVRFPSPWWGPHSARSRRLAVQVAALSRQLRGFESRRLYSFPHSSKAERPAVNRLILVRFQVREQGVTVRPVGGACLINRCCSGSTPAWRTQARVAELVQLLSYKKVYTGSSPVAGTLVHGGCSSVG